MVIQRRGTLAYYLKYELSREVRDAVSEDVLEEIADVASDWLKKDETITDLERDVEELEGEIREREALIDAYELQREDAVSALEDEDEDETDAVLEMLKSAPVPAVTR